MEKLNWLFCMFWRAFCKFGNSFKNVKIEKEIEENETRSPNRKNNKLSFLIDGINGVTSF